MAKKTIRRKRRGTHVPGTSVRKSTAKRSPRKAAAKTHARAPKKKAPPRRTRRAPLTKPTGSAARTARTSVTAALGAAPALTGFVVLPQVSGNGYYSYSPSSKQFGTPATIQGIVDVGRRWQADPVTAGTPFGAGDISVEEGGPLPPHTTGHQKGRNVDLRPMRTDGKRLPVTFRSAEYSRELTQRLVDSLLADTNTSFILFNDPQVTGVRPLAGHDNHLHVQLKS